MTTEQLKTDITHLRSRIETGKAVEPVEIENQYVSVINYISETYKVVDSGVAELIPKAVLHIMTNLWINKAKYTSSFDRKRNRIGDHTSSFHLSHLRHLVGVVEKLDLIQGGWR